MNERDISKLPRWAQDRMVVLERETRHYRELALTGTTPGAARITMEDYGQGTPHVGEERALPTDRVRIYLGKPGDRHNSVELSVDDGRLCVRAYDYWLCARPEAANVMQLWVGK